MAQTTASFGEMGSLVSDNCVLCLQWLWLSGTGNQRLLRNKSLISHRVWGRSGSLPPMKRQPRHLLFSLKASRDYTFESQGSSTELPRRGAFWTHCRFLTRPRRLKKPAVRHSAENRDPSLGVAKRTGCTIREGKTNAHAQGCQSSQQWFSKA